MDGRTDGRTEGRTKGRKDRRKAAAGGGCKPSVGRQQRIGGCTVSVEVLAVDHPELASSVHGLFIAY